ncbi:hypothetical protein GIB67_004445 [Kingdonia uniflora]|uniref:Coilin N-terminal domain-containing protein n=1 Tax=Kingdonia uniflora TaxID=39325 RepID=A0A7J7MRQ8_9MAGN|nr:hypothetical protein GIB67_004445 [Kingdonia uniflora]
MESAIRLRLLFDNRYLSISQKTEGLKRSWLLLKPEFETIFDLESYLVHAFDLGDACPNGLLFSMDGFVVPPFESTQIFKDKDIIRVKRRACTLEDVVRICDEVSSPEDSGIVEKRLVPSGAKLLALEEIENESGGYQSELEENSSDEHDVELSLESPPGRKTTSKKRKSSHKLQSAKRKKIKSSTNDGNDVVTELNQGCHSNGVLSKKKSHKKDKSSKKKGNLIILSTIEVGDRDTNIAQPVPSELRYYYCFVALIHSQCGLSNHYEEFF